MLLHLRQPDPGCGADPMTKIYIFLSKIMPKKGKKVTKLFWKYFKIVTERDIE
jgi:hypothetical protein